MDNHPKAPGMMRRVACMFYELFLVGGLVFVAGFVFTTATQMRHALEYRLALQVWTFFVLMAYFAWFWSKGQTLAMKTWHIHLERVDGKSMSLQKAMFRYLWSWIWLVPPLGIALLFKTTVRQTVLATIGWWVFLFLAANRRTDKQFLHDVLAGTHLVYLKPDSSIKNRKNPRSK